MMCMLAKSLQLCLTLCDLVDHSQLRSSVHGFSRQEYWSGLPCPSPEDLPDSWSPASAGRFFTSTTGEALRTLIVSRVNAQEKIAEHRMAVHEGKFQLLLTLHSHRTFIFLFCLFLFSY